MGIDSKKPGEEPGDETVEISREYVDYVGKVLVADTDDALTTAEKNKVKFITKPGGQEHSIDSIRRSVNSLRQKIVSGEDANNSIDYFFNTYLKDIIRSNKDNLDCLEFLQDFMAKFNAEINSSLVEQKSATPKITSP